MRDYESLSKEEVISKEEAIFYDALEIGDDRERQAFLQEACGKRRTLRVAVENNHSVQHGARECHDCLP